MAHEKLIYNGLILKGTLADGTGDSMLTVSATGVVKKVPAVSSGLSTTLASGNIYVGNVSNVATSVTPSGDVTISNTGATAITPGVIVNADISGSAAIAFSKLAALTASKATVTDGLGVITTSTTSATELGYVTGVTSSIQTQLNSKQATITGAATTITSANLTPNFALISSPTGKVSISGISTTVLNYLTNVTSDVQNQINTIIAGSQTSALLQAPTGSEDGYAITWDSGNSEFNLTPISAAGVPNGGTTGQYLIKNSNSDQDTAWSTFVLADITDVFVTPDEVNSLDGLDTANVGATQFNYLSGLSGNVQTQLDEKLTDSLAYNALFVGNGSNLVSQLAPGANGQVLTIVGTAPTWQTPTPPGNVSGVGPSVDNAVARWNGITADSIQNSVVIISDAGDVSGVATLTATDISTGTTIGGAYVYRAGGTDVAVADGGTGISSYTTGDILFASGATTLSKLAAGTSGYVLTSNGAGMAPSWQVGGGGGTVTTTSVVSANGFAGTVANASTTPAITLTTTVSGILKGDGTSISAAIAGTDYQAALGYTAENTANKDATGGYAGLTLFKINFKNVANTFTSFLTNTNTAARTYTFQDRNGTIADDTDLSLKAPLASPTFTGTVTVPTPVNQTDAATKSYVDTSPAVVAGRLFMYNNFF